MGSSLSKRRERDEDHDNHDEEGAETRLVLKKARFESWGDTDVVVIVGNKEFPECSRFLRCWSGYFEDELNKTPGKTTFEFPDKVPEEWELLKNVLHPFAAESIQTTNYHVLLPWFATLRCEAGLGETDTCILTKIIDPLLLEKPEKERTAADVAEIVTVLEHCVTWSRTGPRDSCITFLRQIFKDPGQPFEGKDLLRIVLLLTKDDACQKALWKFVKYYLPAELVESSSFPADKVKLVADNPLLLDVIEANMKLKKCLYVVELKLKQVVATQNTSNSNSTPTANENTTASASASKEDEKEKAVDPETTTEKPKKKKADSEPEKKQQRRVNPYKKQPKDAPESHKKNKTSSASASAMEKAKSAMEKAKSSVEKAKSALEDKVEKTRKVLEKKSSSSSKNNSSSKNSNKNKDGSGSDSEKSVAENEEPDCVVLVEV